MVNLEEYYKVYEFSFRICKCPAWSRFSCALAQEWMMGMSHGMFKMLPVLWACTKAVEKGLLN